MSELRFGLCGPLFANPGPGCFRTPAWTALEPGDAVDAAVEAERLGYDSIWVADHLMHGFDDAILEGWTTLELAPLQSVMAESDVVVCTAPLTPRTRRMLGTAELDLLKRDAVFVNVSRGAIVDPEPITAGSPIRDLPNVFLSPHIAGVTAPCRPGFFSFMVDDLERYFAGHETLFDITPSTLANRRGVSTTGV